VLRIVGVSRTLESCKTKQNVSHIQQLIDRGGHLLSHQGATMKRTVPLALFVLLPVLFSTPAEAMLSKKVGDALRRSYSCRPYQQLQPRPSRLAKAGALAKKGVRGAAVVYFGVAAAGFGLGGAGVLAGKILEVGTVLFRDPMNTRKVTYFYRPSDWVHETFVEPPKDLCKASAAMFIAPFVRPLCYLMPEPREERIPGWLRIVGYDEDSKKLIVEPWCKNEDR